jgi:hypothetical protein
MSEREELVSLLIICPCLMPEIMRVSLILSRSNCIKIVSLEQIRSEKSEDAVVGKKVIEKNNYVGSSADESTGQSMMCLCIN